ncbi:MAG: isoprenyl transferase [Chloroflexi bacterium]|nr:isoprenyl transferase [Chloroflexota bacterium]
MVLQQVAKPTIVTRPDPDALAELGVPPERIPRHIGIIMDGNGRWAKARGLPRLAGHRAGTQNIRRVLEACRDFGVEVLTIYAFSTENWQRPPREVEGLMRLLSLSIHKQLKELDEEGVQIRHCGRLEGVMPRLRRRIEEAVERTKDNNRIILNVAFNYGGRAEILDAVRAIVREGIPPEEIDEEVFSAHLYTAGLPDPDLIIRTSGEYRLSNFLIWQAAYAEFYVTPAYWPDFDRQELMKAIRDYASRERRFGRLPDSSSG